MVESSLGPCCATGSFHSGKVSGSEKTIDGLKTYVTEGDLHAKVIVLVTDIFGLIDNARLIADQFAKQAGYKVFVPDLFNGDPYLPDDKRELMAWVGEHPVDKAHELIKSFVKEIKSEYKPTKIYGIGYCYGAKIVVKEITKDGIFDAGALAHPSFTTEEDYAAVEKPIIISVGDIDSLFTPEAREGAIKVLGEESKKKGYKWQLNLFSAAPHGYAVRGDISQPVVKYAKEKTLLDQIIFFDSLDLE